MKSNDPDAVICRVVTQGQTAHQKQKVKQENTQVFRPPKKCKTVASSGRVMAWVAWDAGGVNQNHRQQDTIVNLKYYANKLRQLQGEVSGLSGQYSCIFYMSCKGRCQGMWLFISSAPPNVTRAGYLRPSSLPSAKPWALRRETWLWWPWWLLPWRSFWWVRTGKWFRDDIEK